MLRQSSSVDSPLGGRFDPLCRILFELGLILALCTLALSAIHGLLINRMEVSEVIDATHVRTTGSMHPPSIGTTCLVYRFHGNWQQPIGTATVELVDPSGVTFAYDPRAMRWPMGRHGRVNRMEGSTLKLSLGSSLNFAVGDKLDVFDRRKPVAVVELTEIGPTESSAVLVRTIGGDRPVESLLGDVVSEYSVATQVVSSSESLFAVIDLVFFGLGFGGYALFWAIRRESPFCALLPTVVAGMRRLAKLRTVGLVLLGVPTAWYGAQFLIGLVAYGVHLLYTYGLDQAIPGGFDFASLQVAAVPFGTILLYSYFVILIGNRRSPFKWIADRIAFRGGLFQHPARRPFEHVVMWMLQAIIVFTFARTLMGFFQANWNLAISGTWPHAPAVIDPSTPSISIQGFQRTLAAISYAFTHKAAPASEDALFQTVRLIISNACIVGGLLGYGYSMLAYLWGKRIRNVDFTLVGWIVNSVCYWPLLGFAIWQMLPPVTGVDPIVTAGPFRTATFVSEAALNVLYTLTIWNLGVLFGVMTDKGVRRTGFYSVVRHPSYALESLMFVVYYCRGLSTPIQWFAVLWFVLIYWLRSEREDQFMSASNPEYLEYRRQVPFKFVPGLY